MSMLHGFELLREQTLPEIASQARLYRHTRTGAELLALTNDDPNKTFCVAFRILPTDDTGVAHILEHCLLTGGSRKYPVKELHVELGKGSLATLITGFMHYDKPVYTCASRHLKDFENLMDVYLDAVLHPGLTRQTFEQEGWRYELEDLDAPLTYAGVVLNEVKAGYGSADEMLSAETGPALFPDTVYGRNVGGHFRHMPDLTYEQLLAFHAEHYHPTNARFFLYGDLPLEACLLRVDTQLEGFQRAPANPSIPIQQPFDTPRSVTASYATEGDGADHKAYVRMSWVLADNSDPVRTFALEVLREALLTSPAAPLRRGLLDSGLGEDLDGLDDWIRPGISDRFLLRQFVFSAGLKRVVLDRVDRVEPLILDTLETLARDGLAPETLEAAFNTGEFRLRENNPAGFLAGQRGVALTLRALGTWLYDDDPFALLAFEAPMAALKARWARDPRYFEGLIRTHLLDNPHRVTVSVQPDPGLLQREAAGETEQLARAREAMSREELQAIVENTRRLKRLQETPNSTESVSSLPVLKRSDVADDAPRIPVEILEEAQARVLYHPLPTNGIVYLDVGFDLRALSPADLPYAAVFGPALLEMGTQAEDVVHFAQRVGRFTGGIQPELLASEAYGDSPGPVWLFLRAKAMTHNADELLSILRDLLLRVNWDNQERFRGIVLREIARREASLPYSSQTVNRRLRSHFTQSDWANDQLTGIGSLFSIRQLAQEVESDWHAVRARLQSVHAALVNRNAMLVNITLDAPDWPGFRPKLTAFLADLPLVPVEHAQWTRPMLPANEGFAIPSQVNSVGKGADLFRLGYMSHGSALAITRHLGSTWIWNKIRAEGGAYGASAGFDHLSGVFTYLSNYDPNLLQTLNAYDGTSDFLRGVELSEDEVTKSIIGAIGAMDKYQLRDAQGFTSMARHLAGDDDENRQRLREELLSTTAAHFKSFADVLSAVQREGHVVIIAAEERLRTANDQRDGEWLTVTRAL